MNNEEQAQSFAVGEECVVIVETTSGNVEARGWPEARVEVQAPESEARVRQEGATVRVHPRRGGSNDIQVRVPEYSSVMLRSVSGDAEVSNIAGEVSVQTTSGDVEIERVRGRLQVHSVSGDVEVRQSSLSGLSVDTVSGDLEVETTLHAQGEYSVRGVSGDLKLWLPAGQQCTIHSTSLSGHFRCELPHEIVEQGRRNLEARINGGGAAFHVRSTSGDVSVRAAEGAWIEEEPRAAPEPMASEPAEAPFAEEVRSEPSAPGRETRPLPQQAAADTEPFGVEETRVPRAGTEETTAAGGEPSPTTQRMEVLKAIEEGRISVSEGLAKLRALE